jgi:SAM-dependent methyltransferase
MAGSTKSKVNLACGSAFVAGDGWTNLDYAAANEHVLRANLLGRLPLPDDGAALVYCSHFLEHIPRSQVVGFLAECFRVLAPGGTLRLVLPDLENLCRAYLEHRERGEHDKADFVVLEMVDQCVRRTSGGELGRFYGQLRSDPATYAEMMAFVRERTGEDLSTAPPTRRLGSLGGGLRSVLGKLLGRLQRLWIRSVLQLLPTAFREQNVSLAAVGERHHWLWDFHQVRVLLEEVGLQNVERHQASSSGFEGFPFQALDLDGEGRPRKGAESMYIEARKPG